MSVSNSKQIARIDRDSRASDLIALVRELVHELHGERSSLMEVTLSSRLDRDLGIDSLGRTELILRIERTFLIPLPIRVMGEAETVGDILNAIEQGGDAHARVMEPRSIPDLPAVEAPTDARTLPAVLDWHAAQHPDRPHVTVLQDDRVILATLTYDELAKTARAVAAGLLARDIMPGDRVALMLPTGVDFFAAFFGILYAGAVPVPIYPPMQLAQIEEYARRQAGILRNAGARLLITVPEGLRLGTLLRALVTTMETVASVEDLKKSPTDFPLPNISDPSATALIQYTSGSTGDPKGVVLSHANLLANIQAIGQAIKATSSDIFVSWLPLYHDMGLIGAWLGCLYFGAPLYIMSPVTFLTRPKSWLWAIHRFRGTISAAPNFAFELCIKKIDESDLAGLDLSSLRMVANGAEPVSVGTLRGFIELFQPHGFRPEAMVPVYGLAENAVAVTLPPLGRPPIIDTISRKALSRGVAEPAIDKADSIEIVACGRPVPNHEVRIIDEGGQQLGDRREGRLEFRGPSATSGYFRNEAKTHELFHDGWLDSGDRAYIANGDVFITGRVKDIVIRAGQHIYPHEIEEVVGDIPGIRKGAVAAFGVRDSESGTERIVVLAETDVVDSESRELLRARAREKATDAAGTTPDDIVLVKPGTVPKTQSGKIRRAAAKDLYVNGQFDRRKRTLRWQILRLSLTGVWPLIFRSARVVLELTYAAWWWVVIAMSLVLGTVAVVTLPRLIWRWAVLRGLARTALALLGAPVSVTGLQRIPLGHVVLMFNHASYVDALVLVAVLPGEPAYLAKKEFADQIFIGALLRRLGVLFVERYDLAGSLEDMTIAVAAARSGRTLVVLPEGTFARRAGLSGFYLGGFKVASEAEVPVLPGVLCGTRTMLRGDQWFPRWTSISVEIAEPIRPLGKDFASVLRLRDSVRRAMLDRCGEPDMNELLKPPPPRDA